VPDCQAGSGIVLTSYAGCLRSRNVASPARRIAATARARGETAGTLVVMTGLGTTVRFFNNIDDKGDPVESIVILVTGPSEPLYVYWPSANGSVREEPRVTVVKGTALLLYRATVAIVATGLVLSTSMPN
jgi:hypothetical protein